MQKIKILNIFCGKNKFKSIAKMLGGAIRINKVGKNLTGKFSSNNKREKINVDKIIQKNVPTLKK